MLMPVAVAIVLLLPLAILPGAFFYYDVTPKALVVFAGAAVLCIVSIRPGWPGRRYSGLLLAMAAMAAVSASLSPETSLAWWGSNWRRLGAATEIAVIVAAAGASQSRARPLLRAQACAGLLCALYGICQYFGWDPLFAPSSYQVGEGTYQIVRPPSTLGHSDYFAAYLVWPIFSGAALVSIEQGWWRRLGIASGVTGACAIVLSGSRGAILGVAAGACLLGYLASVPIRKVAIGLAVAIVAAGVFYLSPAGARLRARAFWISEDPAGGARLLLWRDSLHMARDRPLAGFGPDVFVARFPQYESRELARAYPGFYHESPHNLFLDALVSEGLPGLLLWCGLIATGAATGWARRGDPIARALLAGLLGVVIVHQFVVVTIPNAFLLLLGIGILTSSDGSAHFGAVTAKERRRRPRPSVAALVTEARWVFVPLALCVLWVAVRLTRADIAYQATSRSIREGDASGAAQSYRTALERSSAGLNADLQISLLAAQMASQPANESQHTAAATLARLSLAQLALTAGRAAVQHPEQRQNAYYNLAILAASANLAAQVESALRGAIAASPSWFKPHWTLARLLAAQGRLAEARQEAELALDLDAGKDAEVVQSMQEIVRSPSR